jgi:signal transduction histidine kinase/ActR/RegA family two-component response regulator
MIKRDETGHFTRMIGVNRDVTLEREHEQELASALAKEKELAEQARAGEQAKGEFLAAMSHELRTPMNGILGFAELLDQSEDLPQGCRQYSQTIMQSGEALLRILDDILDFSQLEAGRLRIEASRFDPRKVVDDVRHLLSRQAEEKDVHLEASVDPETPHELIGDAGRIRQILVNLVGNAIKFTDHGSVSIYLSQVANTENFAFRVKDTGSGISEEKLESIFQPFTQADSRISRRYGGTGLGLTITRRLAELLGGSISVASQEGEGSEFLAVIPLKLPDPTSEGGAIIPVEVLDANFAHEHPLNILIVEDDKINLRLIQTLVRRLGYEPLTAQNGRDAVEVYRSRHPDCILMDLQMPEMDGIEATSEIRATERSHQLKDAYIFALTANILPADKKRCFDAGMNEYLNKPVRINALAKLLAAAENFHRQHEN